MAIVKLQIITVVYQNFRYRIEMATHHTIAHRFDSGDTEANDEGE